MVQHSCELSAGERQNPYFIRAQPWSFHLVCNILVRHVQGSWIHVLREQHSIKQQLIPKIK